MPLQTNAATQPALARPAATTQAVTADSEPKMAGAWIQVRVPPIKGQDIWVVVQWRDNQGVWRDIDGWRGQFDEYVDGVGRKTWWVEEGLFGTGMFKWLVYDRGDGRRLGESAAFSLPNFAGQVLVKSVSPLSP
jgi:hypothetical protein